MRTFDLNQQFNAIKEAAISAVKNIFPIDGRTRIIKLDDVHIEDNIVNDDYSKQSKVKSRNGTWGIPVYANLSLYEKGTNNLLDRATNIRLFMLPKITPRFSYIVNGNEYQVHNQLRLKPGVYTIRKQNGQLGTQVNLSAGKNFDIVFNEEKGQFFITKIAGAQANIPLYSILHYLGISDHKMSEAWGQKIMMANKTSDEKDLVKAREAFGVRRGNLASYFNEKTKMDPEVTKKTVGGSFDKVSGNMLLASSKKLLDVHMGRKKPEDRDSLDFKEIHSLDDYIKERLEKNRKSLEYKIRRSIDSPKRTKISQIVNPGAFNSIVESFFTQDDKSSTPEQTNPLEMLSGQYRTTIMGSGGIKSRHAITPEMREVHHSHYGFLDPIETPESERIGANLSIPLGVVKDGKKLKTIVVDKNNKRFALSTEEAFVKKIAFPGQGDNKMVKVIHKGKVSTIPRSGVDYFTPSPHALFSWSANLLPYLPVTQGNRAMMAAKQLEQAISLKHREVPLVQVGAGEGGSMEERIGKQSAIFSPFTGIVKKIDKDFINIQTPTGVQKINLYNNYSLNRKSFLHHELKVKVGDQVKKGDIIADSNYTKDGVLALGANLRTAYLPYKGLNFEDGIVISESAAKKLTSEHIHKKEKSIDFNTILNLSAFRTQYPNLLVPANVKKLDKDGVVLKGQQVELGDVVIAALQKRKKIEGIGVVQRQLADRPKDVSVSWNSEDPGTVTDVQKTSKHVIVFIRTEEPAKVGDKLSGRYGNKGIITKIIPNAETPSDKSGEPVDILLNPHGVISRINVGQIYESASGKAAKKAGKPHVVNNFSGENYLTTTKKYVKDQGVDDKEELFDPETGKSLGKVHVGNPYTLKLFKQSTGNFSYRQGGPGSAYDANLQPLRSGGEESSKSLDLLTTYSMLSHGARANLRDMATIKANQNDEYWKALKSGQQLPPPKSPFVYDKFTGYLKGAGIDIKKDGSKMTLVPLTDEEISNISSGEVKNPRFYRAKDMRPERGGFLDPVKFGGFNGKKWGHIELKEPVINPVFENAIKKITGLGKKIDDIMSGKLYLHPDGTMDKKSENGITSGEAIKKILDDINVEEQIGLLTEKAKSARTNSLDAINKKLRYLYALRDTKLKPSSAYIRKKVPVIPPMYRPIYALSDGNVTTSDSNLIYQNIGVLNEMNKLPVMDLLIDEEKADLRKDIYNHVKAISGINDINIKGKDRKGFISEIKGGSSGSPKEGFFISKMLSKKQDYVGRATIIPEPTLGIDEAALPERMAWKLFEPFVVRELAKFGKTPNSAKDEIKKKTPLARKALDIVLKDRHILLKRDPSLHKFSIMAFKPKVTTGTAIKIPPLVTRGFNADFDGDQQLAEIIGIFSKKQLLQSNVDYDSFVEKGELMTARFKEFIPCLTDDDVVSVINLSRFPKGDRVREIGGSKGLIKFYEAIPGTKVFAINENTGKLELAKVSNWSVHIDREVEIVDLLSGRQILTDDDPRAVYGINCGELRYTRNTPSDATTNKMFIPRGVRYDVGIEIDTPIKIKKSLKNTSSEIKTILPLDNKLGYFIGAIAGDGWGDSFLNVNMASIYGPITEKYKRIVEKFYKICPTIHTRKGESSYGESYKHTFYCPTMCKHVIEWVGKGADNKCLPSFYLSANRDFREGLFAGLMDTDGSISCVKAKAKNKPQLMSNFQSNSLVLAQQAVLLAASLGIKGRITPSKTPAGKKCWMVAWSNVDIYKWGGKYMAHQDKLSAMEKAPTPDSSAPAHVKQDIVPVSFSLANFICKKIGAKRDDPKDRKSIYTVFAKAKRVGSVSRFIAKKLNQYMNIIDVLEHEDGSTWLKIVENSNVTWDQVVSFCKTGIKETGYDLTVPGYETFMNVEGVVLSNTMMAHVPISHEANKEAERMLPSRNLYKPGTGALMIAPDQEAQIGLYYLSKTSKGRDRLNKLLPKGFRIKNVLRKGATRDLLKQMSDKLKSNEFADIVHILKTEGEKHAYERGFTIGLDDLVDFGPNVDKALKAIGRKAEKAKSQKELKDLNATSIALIDRLISQKLHNKDNALYDMMDSGARGSKTNLRSIMISPVFVNDARNNIVPKVIERSYSKGLDVGDYWTSMFGARKGMMDRAIQTSLPGAFSKDIMANTIDNVITGSDCGTKRGIAISIDSSDCLDRFLSVDQHGFLRNTLVDGDLIKKMKKKRVKTLNVRTPLMCLQPKGTCSKCYGLDEHGEEPAMGENVGAKAGQTISEPLVQLIMNSFHTGGAAGTGMEVGGFKRIEQLLHMPDKLTGAASLAPESGVIKNIKPGIAGGYDVYVNDKKVHVVKGRRLKVIKGQTVSAGDPLSDGPIKPQELAKYKGMESSQKYIANELHKTYGQQGQKIHKKVFETVVRSVANITKVLNNPKDATYIPGDFAPYSVVNNYNNNLESVVDTDDARGEKLAESVGTLRAGHVLSLQDIKYLTSSGYRKVKIKKDAIKHQPYLKGVTTIPLLKQDWMAALGYRDLKKALIEGASQGWVTDTSGVHPVPAFARGEAFGKGKEGEY